MSKNKVNLTNARNAKFDEFYTQFSDVEAELNEYKEHFKDKVIYCNCDKFALGDVAEGYSSNFAKYFIMKYRTLGIKKVIATCYNEGGHGTKLEFSGVKEEGRNMPLPSDFEVSELEGNGDFQSAECIEIMKGADVVVTNPPFSLFRDFVKTLMDYDKKFVILGNMNAITYSGINPYIKDNKMWLGIHCGSKTFEVPMNYSGRSFIGEDGKKYAKLGNVIWYTNLDHHVRNEEYFLFKKYEGHEDEYPKYDNYDAIEVSKTKFIPKDYNGVMGVPISFLPYYCPKQFEIVKFGRGDDDKYVTINGETPYYRILIKRINKN